MTFNFKKKINGCPIKGTITVPEVKIKELKEALEEDYGWNRPQRYVYADVFGLDEYRPSPLWDVMEQVIRATRMF